MRKKQFKLKLEIEIDSNGQFLVSDNLFYDWGCGGSLEDCLADYAKTLVERSRITHDSSQKKQLKTLRKFLQIG